MTQYSQYSDTKKESYGALSDPHSMQQNISLPKRHLKIIFSKRWHHWLEHNANISVWLVWGGRRMSLERKKNTLFSMHLMYGDKEHPVCSSTAGRPFSTNIFSPPKTQPNTQRCCLMGTAGAGRNNHGSGNNRGWQEVPGLCFALSHLYSSLLWVQPQHQGCREETFLGAPKSQQTPRAHGEKKY